MTAPVKIALAQMCSGIDPAANATALEAAIEAAALGGAQMLFTPEMTGLVDGDRTRAKRHVVTQDEDMVLARARAAAARHKIWLHIGSLALLSEAGDGRFVNRAFVIDAEGHIVAHYDKLHLFDVDLPTGESWRESNSYTPGSGAVVAATQVGGLGLSICYDVRFPALFQALSAAGATVIATPAAFTVPTGQAHWHILLRARAIENACFLIATGQAGHHEDGRVTYGHSLVIDPWGRVLLDMGETTGLGFATIDTDEVNAVRGRIPVIAHRRSIPAVTHA